jgi:hypothetical protein
LGLMMEGGEMLNGFVLMNGCGKWDCAIGFDRVWQEGMCSDSMNDNVGI